MPSIPDPDAALTLGALDLMGHDKSGPYWFEALGESHDMGNPVPIEREIETLLQDGAVVAVDSYGNRVMTMRVVVCGEDSPGLALGEKALLAELRRRNVLTWVPPNIITGSGDPCVFDVVHSEPSSHFDDVLELSALQRVYTLTIQALPHARSAIRRDVALAVPGGVSPVVTSINACTSTTGFVASPVGTVLATSGGVVSAKWSNSSLGDVTAAVSLRLSGLSTAMTGTPFVRIDFSTTGTGRYGAQVDGVRLNNTLVAPVAASGTVRWYPFSAAATLTSVEIVTTASVSRYGKLNIFAADISRSSLAQDAAGTRQLFGSVNVAGSVRTEATLTIADETPTALGSVLLYTAPNRGTVTQPPLRTRRVAGSAETTNTALVSGKSSDLATLHSFDIPATEVPDGTYLLMARVFHATAATYTLTWAARSRMGSVDLGSAVTGTQSFALAASTWTMVPVALVPLPTRTLGSAGMVRIDLTGVAGLLLDEAWIFNTDTGVLSWVECGTTTPTAGGDSNRLWFEPASLDHPTVSVTRGMASDGSDAYAPVTSLWSWGAHELVPPSMSIFAVTTNSVAMAVTGSYFARFHTHVVED